MVMDVMEQIGVSISAIYPNKYELIFTQLIFQGLDSLKGKDLHQEPRNSQKKSNLLILC